MLPDLLRFTPIRTIFFLTCVCVCACVWFLGSPLEASRVEHLFFNGPPASEIVPPFSRYYYMQTSTYFLPRFQYFFTKLRVSVHLLPLLTTRWAAHLGLWNHSEHHPWQWNFYIEGSPWEEEGKRDAWGSAWWPGLVPWPEAAEQGRRADHWEQNKGDKRWQVYREGLSFSKTELRKDAKGQGGPGLRTQSWCLCWHFFFQLYEVEL